MSNLSEHVKKYLVDNISLLLLFIFLIVGWWVILTRYWASDWQGFGLLLLWFLIFWIVKKLVNNKLDKWTMPELNIAEKKQYNYVDLAYSIALGVIVILVVYLFTKEIAWILVVFVIIMIAVRERNKRKELKETKPVIPTPVVENVEDVK